MDLQQYLHEGLKKMFVGKVVNIQTERVLDSVAIVEVEIKDSLIVLKTDKKDTCEILLSFNTHEFHPFYRHKYSIMFMPDKIGWTSHDCDEAVEIIA